MDGGVWEWSAVRTPREPQAHVSATEVSVRLELGSLCVYPLTQPGLCTVHLDFGLTVKIRRAGRLLEHYRGSVKHGQPRVNVCACTQAHPPPEQMLIESLVSEGLTPRPSKALERLSAPADSSKAG